MNHETDSFGKFDRLRWARHAAQLPDNKLSNMTNFGGMQTKLGVLCTRTTNNEHIWESQQTAMSRARYRVPDDNSIELIIYVGEI